MTVSQPITDQHPVKPTLIHEVQHVIHAVEEHLATDVANIILGLSKIIKTKSGMLAACLQEESAKAPPRDQKALLSILERLIAQNLGASGIPKIIRALSKDVRDALRKVAPQLLSSNIPIPFEVFTDGKELKSFIEKLNVLPSTQHQATPNPVTFQAGASAPVEPGAGEPESFKVEGGLKTQLHICALVCNELKAIYHELVNELKTTGAL